MTAQQLMQCAMNRLNTAMQYGPDMRSSRDRCVEDAKYLICKALALNPLDSVPELKASWAALNQRAHFDADIRFAIRRLESALN